MSSSDDHLNGNFMYSVYKMLVYMGVDPSLLQANMSTEDADGDGKSAYLMLGVPSTKVGLSVEQDQPTPYTEDGWYVSPTSLKSLQQMHEAFQALEAAVIEHKRRSTMNATKQTSQHEQWLIDAVIRRGLPIPDRNHKLLKDDGKELTTPDMAWAEYKIAFFVDGLWWHQTREDHGKIKQFLEEEDNQEYLIEHNKTRAEKDLTIRSEMQLRGWRVLSCTDRDLEDHQGIQTQVVNIEKMIDMVKSEQRVLSAINESTPGDSGNAQASISDFL